MLTIDPTFQLEESGYEYVNECCSYCDVILKKVIDPIKKEFEISEIEIGEEDWGWYLIFEKDDLEYNIHINYFDENPDQMEFGLRFFVNKKIKKFIFSKRVEDLTQTDSFEKRCMPFLKDFGEIEEDT